MKQCGIMGDIFIHLQVQISYNTDEKHLYTQNIIYKCDLYSWFVIYSDEKT